MTKHNHSTKELHFVDKTPPHPHSILAIGVFDGVHLGHQTLIKTACTLAERMGTRAGVVSFWPHPQELFVPEKPVAYLTTPQEQHQIMLDLGINYFGYFHFTPSFAALTPEGFTRSVLKDMLKVAGIVVGFNFRYGKGNSGNIETLRKAGADLGFAVDVVPPVEKDGAIISSTRIRNKLSHGDTLGAWRLLGRPYFVTGSVVSGHGRGRGLGFPTINLKIPGNRVLPAPGVYSGMARINSGERYKAAIFVGPPLTFNEAVSTIEAHLLDCDSNLYGHEVRLEFREFLRGPAKFDSPQSLVDQIRHDVGEVRKGENL